MEIESHYEGLMKTYRLLNGISQKSKVQVAMLGNIEREIRRVLSLLIEKQLSYQSELESSENNRH